jgi:phage gp37-like protein
MASTQEQVDAMVARINTAAIGISAEAMPERPARQRFIHAVGVVWVAFNGVVFAPAAALDYPVQDGVARFEAVLLVRGLNGPKGANSYVDALQALLHGWALPDGRPLSMVDVKFVDHEDGVWRYDLMFSSKVVAVPVTDDSELEEAPLIKRLRLESAYSESQLDVPEDPEP